MKKILLITICLIWLVSLIGKPVLAGPASVPRYGVWEDSYNYSSAGLANPWENVTVAAKFTTPSGKTINIDGFYYDVNTYKVRLTPAEVGTYAYAVTISGGPDGTKNYSGTFASTASNNSGFLRPYANNPYRWVTEGNGAVATGVGLNACWGKQNNVNASGNVTGGRSGVQVPIDQYFSDLKQLGFTIFRFNPGNCNDFKIGANTQPVPPGNTYNIAEAKYVDQLLAAARKQDLHVDFTILGYSAGEAEVDLKRHMRYIMARYGAYTDIWEVANEVSGMDDTKLKNLTDYIKGNDPYKLLVSNSNERPNDWNYLTARNNHAPGTFDVYSLTGSLSNNFTTGLPVFVGETQHQAIEKDAAQIIPDVRQVTWTGFFGGSPIMWWRGIDPYYNGGFSSAYGVFGQNSPNMPLADAQTAKFVAIASKVDPGVQSKQVLQSVKIDNLKMRAYELSSARSYLLYFWSELGRTTKATTSVTVTIPFSGTASWIDPKTGNNLGTVALSAGSRTLTPPPFLEDVALVMFSSGTSSPIGSGDANNDSNVNALDLKTVLANYLKSATQFLNQYGLDQKINALDFVTVLKRLP